MLRTAALRHIFVMDSLGREEVGSGAKQEVAGRGTPLQLGHCCDKWNSLPRLTRKVRDGMLHR